ncbi:MAG TPA: hypothetical protein VF226_00345 [Hyphomicrobiaceae bacterium]
MIQFCAHVNRRDDMKIGLVTSVSLGSGQRSAEQRIRDMAARYRVKPVRTKLDGWADDVARLSDADVARDEVIDLPDEVIDLVVALQRAGFVTTKEAIDLCGDFLAERQ